MKRLSNFSMCCLKQLHPRVAHNPEFLGTRTDVSLNCPGGTGWLCGRRYALTDLLFQTLCEVSIAIQENHTPSSNTWQRMATTVNACKYLIGCQCPLPAAPWLLAVCFLWLWGSVQTKHQESPDSSRAGMSQHCKTHSHKEWSDETLDQWDLLWLNQKRTGLEFSGVNNMVSRYKSSWHKPEYAFANWKQPSARWMNSCEVSLQPQINVNSSR